MNFGALRVLNDDTLAPGEGFGMHPQNNMELVFIPLEGSLEHRDSMGNVAVVTKGEVQTISAGTGMLHSEYNHSGNDIAKLLQIWVFPREKALEPRYDHVKFTEPEENSIEVIVAPEGAAHIARIHQNAWFSLVRVSKGGSVEYKPHNGKSGVYLFVLDGAVAAGRQHLYNRDGMGITGGGSFGIGGDTDARLLVIEVPMTL